MSVFSSPAIASVWVPKLVHSSFLFQAANSINREIILETLDESTSHRRAILFYAKLIENINTWFDYDYFNYIPLGAEEITALAYYANTLDTQLKDKIELRSSALKVRVIN
jgi:hypothetical protein